MKKLGTLIGLVLVGIGVAITYHLFENAVHGSIRVVWYDWLDTDQNRLYVIPAAITLTFLFFAAQHYLDRKSEDSEEHGLGNMPKPTFINYLKVLFIGFFSLLAGASLGPEAVLVPACMILGGLIGTKLLGQDQKAVKLLSAAAIMALFTAFFDSFIIGVLSLYLVMAQAKVKFQPILLIVAVISSAASLVTLNLIEGEPLLDLPHYDWGINFATVIISVVLAVVGYGLIFVMESTHNLFEKIRNSKVLKVWWHRALVAGIGIASLYLLGGPLVEFTGNLSIKPMFEQAASLGLIGLLWVLVIKIGVISWSKAIGFRGGMIFPTIFLASVLVAIVQLYSKDFNLIYGLIATMIGALAANRKTHVLV